MEFRDCNVTLEGDVLCIENACFKRTYQWNNGHLVSTSLIDKSSGLNWVDGHDQTDLVLPELNDIEPGNGELNCFVFKNNGVFPDHLVAEITYDLGQLSIRRHFRIYPGCPALACDFFFKGALDAELTTENVDVSTLSNIESTAAAKQGQIIASKMESVKYPSSHYKVKTVQFFDITDRRNNLVYETDIMPYRAPVELKGQLLFMKDLLANKGLFILKEAPCTDVQLDCPDFNFVVSSNVIKLIGLGISRNTVKPDEWTRAYGFVTGVAESNDYSLLTNLRKYQKTWRIHDPGRDEMLLLNTWGDRSQDTRLGESFALDELEHGARLGVTHFQLDDGWQVGVSSNSATGAGSLEGIWERDDYWQVNLEKFPNGLKPIKDKADQLGIELCLWFNPSKCDSYANWEKDADTLIGFYNDFKIRTFKIDGVSIPDKQADINLRKMFDKVLAATDNNAVFNLDVTAGKRFGYHYYTEYGNKFLENRYTDWVNYYPHWSLRNLWQLSRYVPSQLLQIEFLNKWRNADKYPSNDPLAPANVPFDFCFAVTMMAQPLAWFESSQLPEEAFEIAPLIEIYKKHQLAIHDAVILPVGDEPDGISWSGFQSMKNDQGYVLILRQLSNQNEATISLWGLEDKEIQLEHICGYGESFKCKSDQAGNVTFNLPKQWSFALYKYSAT